MYDYRKDGSQLLFIQQKMVTAKKKYCFKKVDMALSMTTVWGTLEFWLR